MDPAVTSLLTYESNVSELILCFGDLFQTRMEYVFLPVNSNTNLPTELKSGQTLGSHWALLVYRAEKEDFIYFDSMGGILKSAERLAQKFCCVYNSDEKLIKKKADIKFNLKTPKQKNSFDCGIFVLTFTQKIFEFLEKDEKNLVDEKFLFDDGIDKEVSSKRKEIKKLILDLADADKKTNEKI